MQASSKATGLPLLQLHTLPAVLAVMPPVSLGSSARRSQRSSRSALAISLSLMALLVAAATLATFAVLRWRRRRRRLRLFMPRSSAHGKHGLTSSQVRIDLKHNVSH